MRSFRSSRTSSLPEETDRSFCTTTAIPWAWSSAEVVSRTLIGVESHYGKGGYDRFRPLDDGPPPVQRPAIWQTRSRPSLHRMAVPLPRPRRRSSFSRRGCRGLLRGFRNIPEPFHLAFVYSAVWVVTASAVPRRVMSQARPRATFRSQGFPRCAGSLPSGRCTRRWRRRRTPPTDEGCSFAPGSPRGVFSPAAAVFFISAAISRRNPCRAWPPFPQGRLRPAREAAPLMFPRQPSEAPSVLRGWKMHPRSLPGWKRSFSVPSPINDR